MVLTCLLCFVGFWLLCVDLLFGTHPIDCEIGFYRMHCVISSGLNKRQFKSLTESYQSCTQLLAIHKCFYHIFCIMPFIKGNKGKREEVSWIAKTRNKSYRILSFSNMMH
jgi:hypothetical protein